MFDFEKIIVYGAGATGLTIAGALKKSLNEQKIRVIARNSQVDAITQNRLNISSVVDYNIHFSDKEIFPIIDFSLESTLLICTMKSIDLIQSLKQIIPYLTNTTKILILQNGYGLKNDVQLFLKENNLIIEVCRGILTLAATLENSNCVSYFGGGIKLENIKISNNIKKLFDNSFISCEVSLSFKEELLKKLLINSIVNPLSAIYYCNNHEVANRKGEIEYLKDSLFVEGKMICKALRVDIDLSLEEFNDFIDSENTSSMLQDIKKLKQTEIEYINGALIKIGNKLNIDTPVNDFIYQTIKYLELNFKDKQI